MYVPNDFQNYKYLVSVHDNYVVLTNRSHVNASYTQPQTINTISQYIYPSIYTLESTSVITSERYFDEIDIDSSFYSRADCPNIICATFCVGLFIVFLINGLTRLVKRGGIFFGY